MITTDNPEYDERFRLLRQHGMSVPAAERHGTKKAVFESYVTAGYNYRMTDIQASIGIVQLGRLPGMVTERRRLAALYHERLQDIKWLKAPDEPAYAKSNWQSYPVRLNADAPLKRDELMKRLLDEGVSAKPGIMNAHAEPPYSMQDWNLPDSERARASSVLLPMHSSLALEQLEHVINSLKGGL
jgi:dTDP-4-amino-4,6-dideoxygalactose transaminase